MEFSIVQNADLSIKAKQKLRSIVPAVERIWAEASQMSRKTLPQYVLKALERRRKIADRLMDACAEVDSLTKRFGVDTDEVPEVFSSGCMIYCEPRNAEKIALELFEKTITQEEKR